MLDTSQCNAYARTNIEAAAVHAGLSTADRMKEPKAGVTHSGDVGELGRNAQNEVLDMIITLMEKASKGVDERNPSSGPDRWSAHLRPHGGVLWLRSALRPHNQWACCGSTWSHTTRSQNIYFCSEDSGWLSKRWVVRQAACSTATWPQQGANRSLQWVWSCSTKWQDPVTLQTKKSRWTDICKFKSRCTTVGRYGYGSERLSRLISECAVQPLCSTCCMIRSDAEIIRSRENAHRRRITCTNQLR
jgi:hypothetical protein